MYIRVQHCLWVLAVVLVIGACKDGEEDEEEKPQKVTRPQKKVKNRDRDGGRKLGMSANRKLYADLFEDYNRFIRPISDQAKPIVVDFGVAIIEIVGLQDNNGHMRLKTWLEMAWKDDQLQWTPGKYEDVEEIHVPATEIWVPDIVMYNSIESSMPIDNLQAIVNSRGQVELLVPATFTTTCHHLFRTNSWNCDLKFLSWSYTENQLEIRPLNGKADIDERNMQQNDYFTVVDHGGENKDNALVYKISIRGKMGPSLLGRRKRSFNHVDDAVYMN